MCVNRKTTGNVIAMKKHLNSLKQSVGPPHNSLAMKVSNLFKGIQTDSKRIKSKKSTPL